MCSSPDTVGGGVSMAYTSDRAFDRSNVYVPASCQRLAQVSSMPSRDGFSGIPARLPAAVLVMLPGYRRGRSGFESERLARRGEILLGQAVHGFPEYVRHGADDLGLHGAADRVRGVCGV